MKLSKKYLIWTIIFSVIALAINAYIIIHSCLDAMQSTEASNGVVEVTEEVINTVAPGTITPENHDSFASFARKAFGHFGLFMVSGFFSSLAFYLAISPFNKQKYYQIIIIALSFGLLMGLVTETIQLYVPGRSGEITDVLIDFSGYLLGFLIILLILFLIIRHIRKEEKKQLALS
jgi:VanZ family protein